MDLFAGSQVAENVLEKTINLMFLYQIWRNNDVINEFVFGSHWMHTVIVSSWTGYLITGYVNWSYF